MPEAQAVIDLNHLARYTGGDTQLNAEVLRLFDTQATELVARLHDILSARDAKSWKEVMHTIKGAARGIGAFVLADAAAFAEPIDPCDQNNAAKALDTLEERAGAVQAFIRDYLRAA